MPRLYRMVPWLALAAALTTALLPGGLMPKWAGPCGKALCECAPVIRTAPKCEHCVPASAEPKWTFSADESFQTASDTVAFHVAFTALEAPDTAMSLFENTDCLATPTHDPFALTTLESCPSLRPPRA